MAPALQIFTARSGEPSARVTFPDGRVKHLHSAFEPEKEGAYTGPRDLWADVVILLGVGLGHHLKKFEQAWGDRTVVAVDLFSELATRLSATWAPHWNRHVFDAQGVASGSLAAVLKTLPKPMTCQVIAHPPSVAVAPEFYARVRDEIHAEIASARDANGTSWNSASPIAVLRTNFFADRECLRALASMNVATMDLAPAARQAPSEWEGVVERQFQENKPRLLLSINMRGLDAEGVLIEQAKFHDVPLAVWFVDDPGPILLPYQRHLHRDMTIFCWERAYLPSLKKAGFERVFHLPLAADPRTRGEIPERFAYPLGFVGTAMAGPFLAEMRAKFLWEDRLAPLAEAMAAEILAKPGASVRDLLTEASRSTAITLPFSDERNVTWFCAYAVHLATAHKRTRTIAALLPAGLTLFGDPQGWRTIFGADVAVRPDVDYEIELPGVYRSVAINVNTTSCQMPTAVNQRVFDTPLAGGFLLADDQQDLAELLEPHTESVTYGSVDELMEKVRFFADRPAERLQVVKAAQRRILAEHTYAHRLRFVFEQFGIKSNVSGS